MTRTHRLNAAFRVSSMQWLYRLAPKCVCVQGGSRNFICAEKNLRKKNHQTLSIPHNTTTTLSLPARGTAVFASQKKNSKTRVPHNVYTSTECFTLTLGGPMSWTVRSCILVHSNTYGLPNEHCCLSCLSSALLPTLCYSTTCKNVKVPPSPYKCMLCRAQNHHF